MNRSWLPITFFLKRVELIATLPFLLCAGVWVATSMLLTGCSDDQATQAERSGEMVFNEYCFACHQTGAVGAPKRGDQPAWAMYSEKGLPTMLERTIQGYGRMPRMGTCFECTEAELKSAIEFMMSTDTK